MQVEVTGPSRDLHSGLYGGAVVNPCNVLCEMISSLKDHNNRILFPDFMMMSGNAVHRSGRIWAKRPFDRGSFYEVGRSKRIEWGGWLY